MLIFCSLGIGYLAFGYLVIWLLGIGYWGLVTGFWLFG